MCHEHLLVDQRSVTFSEPEDRRDVELARRPVTLDIFGWVQWNWTHNLDNLVLNDEGIAIEEVTAYRVAGGTTLVDCTLPGIGRDPEALCRIARTTGIASGLSTFASSYAIHAPNVSVASPAKGAESSVTAIAAAAAAQTRNARGECACTLYIWPTRKSDAPKSSPPRKMSA